MIHIHRYQAVKVEHYNHINRLGESGTSLTRVYEKCVRCAKRRHHDEAGLWSLEEVTA